MTHNIGMLKNGFLLHTRMWTQDTCHYYDNNIFRLHTKKHNYDIKYPNALGQKL